MAKSDINNKIQSCFNAPVQPFEKCGKGYLELKISDMRVASQMDRIVKKTFSTLAFISKTLSIVVRMLFASVGDTRTREHAFKVTGERFNRDQIGNFFYTEV